MTRSFIILLHIGYWILYLLLLSLIILMMEAGSKQSFSQNYKHVLGFVKIMGSLTLVPALIAFYTFYGPLFNRYLSKKKFALLSASGIVIILFAGLIGLLGLHFATVGILFANNGFKEMSVIVIFMSVLAFIHGIIALVMKGFISWYADIKIKAALKQQHFETELALVKSQLNPHFLFNTINNIDVLILKDPEKASAYLNKLSDIMRFMLYETKTENIPLQQELEYIKKYIELQKIRSSNHNFVQYYFEGNATDYMIAPMLFIPFIENAFKHTADKKNDDVIKVNIRAERNELHFCCENVIGRNALSHNEPGGLGNELILKRLELLYPSTHVLKTEEESGVYKVNLVIYQ